MYKTSKLLILGASGLLGTALMKKLKDNTFNNVLIPEHKELDLLDKRQVFAYFERHKPEYVFCAAGKVGGIVDNKTYPVDYLNINLRIQLNCFDAAHSFGAKAFVFYGSSCMYPKNSPQPIKEEFLFDGKIEETSQGYASAKIAGIIACKSYNVQYPDGCRFIALVPNSMFGPKDNFNLNSCHVLSALLRRFHESKIEGKREVILWGSGNQRREFIFSEDVANASIFVIKNINKLENTHYNLGTGCDISIRELAEKIAEITDYDGKISWDISKPDGTYRKLLDSGKIRDLGWNSECDFESAVKLTYKWFIENNK